MENPKDRKYSKEHEWIKVDGDTGVVGITDHAQHLLTDVVFVELPSVGQKVEKDKPLGVIESVKSVSDVYSPVTGEVIEVNKELENAPEALNTDPYGDGWVVKVKIADASELESGMSAEEYDAFIKDA